MSKATLLVLQGVDQGKRASIGRQTVSLGRGPQNTIRILDTEVSRNHAEILFENGTWSLHDLDSSNGSFVNGQSIRSQSLKSGDQLQIGRTIMLFTETAKAGSSEIASRIDLLAADDPDQSQIVGDGGIGRGQTACETGVSVSDFSGGHGG